MYCKSVNDYILKYLLFHIREKLKINFKNTREKFINFFHFFCLLSYFPSHIILQRQKKQTFRHLMSNLRTKNSFHVRKLIIFCLFDVFIYTFSQSLLNKLTKLVLSLINTFIFYFTQ